MSTLDQVLILILLILTPAAVALVRKVRQVRRELAAVREARVRRLRADYDNWRRDQAATALVLAQGVPWLNCPGCITTGHGVDFCELHDPKLWEAMEAMYRSTP